MYFELISNKNRRLYPLRQYPVNIIEHTLRIVIQKHNLNINSILSMGMKYGERDIVNTLPIPDALGSTWIGPVPRFQFDRLPLLLLQVYWVRTRS